MAKAEQRVRNYDKADDKMLEQAQTMRNLFETDKADFTAMYTHLANPFSADWQADIDAAQALPTSDEEFAELEVKTEDVETQMELARMQFQKMASYVKLLFPDSKIKQGIFGLDKYDKVRQVQTKMYDLMQLAYRKADSADYKADLIDLGFVQTEIDALNTIAESLYDANEAQEEFKQVIKLRTEERIAAYNKVWESMKAVSAASKQVFVDDYAKLQQYLLYPEGEGGAPGKVLNLVYNTGTGMLSWDVPQSPEPIDKYELERSTDGDNWSQVYQGAANQALVPLLSGANYFRCRAHNKNGWGSWSDTITVTIGLQPPIIWELVYNPSTNKVTLQWHSSIGADYHDVYQSVVPIGDPAGAFTMIQSVSGQVYQHDVSTYDVREYYYIVARNATESSGPSEIVFVDVAMA